jgi:hypothetical protein
MNPSSRRQCALPPKRTLLLNSLGCLKISPAPSLDLTVSIGRDPSPPAHRSLGGRGSHFAGHNSRYRDDRTTWRMLISSNVLSGTASGGMLVEPMAPLRCPRKGDSKGTTVVQ